MACLHLFPALPNGVLQTVDSLFGNALSTQEWEASCLSRFHVSQNTNTTSSQHSGVGTMDENVASRWREGDESEQVQQTLKSESTEGYYREE